MSVARSVQDGSNSVDLCAERELVRDISSHTAARFFSAEGESEFTGLSYSKSLLPKARSWDAPGLGRRIGLFLPGLQRELTRAESDVHLRKKQRLDDGDKRHPLVRAQEIAFAFREMLRNIRGVEAVLVDRAAEGFSVVVIVNDVARDHRQEIYRCEWELMQQCPDVGIDFRVVDRRNRSLSNFITMGVSEAEACVTV